MKSRKFPEIVPFRSGVEVIGSRFNSFAEHVHEFYEFEFVEEGNGKYIVNGQSYDLNRGDLVYVTPMDLHSYVGGNEKFKTITVKFVPDSIAYQLRSVTKLDSFLLHCDKKLQDAFLSIKEESTASDCRDFSVKNCLERILILVLRANRICPDNILEYNIEQILGYINRNFRNSISLDEVAQTCGYSSAHFCRRFKKTTGKTFVEYLNGIRVLHAKNLLLTTKMSVTDIAFECGFGSVRSFNREFLKKYGSSPIEYKNTFKSEH